MSIKNKTNAMTFNEYFRNNNIAFSTVMRMWDRSKYRNIDDFLNAPFVWIPRFKRGDIVLDGNGDTGLFLVVKVDSKNKKYDIVPGFHEINFESKKNDKVECNLIEEYDANDIEDGFIRVIGTATESVISDLEKFQNL